MGAPEVVESMVLVRLPVVACRDIAAENLELSREGLLREGYVTAAGRFPGEKGEFGVFGKGFSRSRLLVLSSCLILSGRAGYFEGAEAGAESDAPAAIVLPTCTVEGL